MPSPVKLLLELSMECESLARAEAIAAASVQGKKPEVVLEEPGVLVLDTDADPTRLANRLGLCHYVDRWLGHCNPNELESMACGIEVDGPIRVRSTKVGESKVDLAAASKRLGGIIGESRGVDLHSPKSDVRVVFSHTVHIGKVEAAVDRPSFEKRKNRHMPFVYPASLHPKFARALVNLSMVPEGGRLLDPFCGTGAILAEACMVGLRAVGSDFSERMILGAERNLAHLNAKAELHLCDIGEIAREVGRVDGIATDPPYGRSTTTDGEALPELYHRAFDAFHTVLDNGSRVAIVIPDMRLIRKIVGFKLLENHELRVHRSLTRNFCVLRKN